MTTPFRPAPAQVGSYQPPGPHPPLPDRRVGPDDRRDEPTADDVAATFRVLGWLKRYPKTERLLWVAGTWLVLTGVQPDVVQTLTTAAKGDAQVARALQGITVRLDSGATDRLRLHAEADSLRRDVAGLARAIVEIRDDLRVIRCAVDDGPVNCRGVVSLQQARNAARSASNRRSTPDEEQP